jgi:hypothetical protein
MRRDEPWYKGVIRTGLAGVSARHPKGDFDRGGGNHVDIVSWRADQHSPDGGSRPPTKLAICARRRPTRICVTRPKDRTIRRLRLDQPCLALALRVAMSPPQTERRPSPFGFFFWPISGARGWQCCISNRCDGLCSLSGPTVAGGTMQRVMHHQPRGHLHRTKRSPH